MSDKQHDLESDLASMSGPGAIPADTVDNISPAPDGGPRAWLVAAGGASIFFCCLGFANSFGTLLQYYSANELKGQSQSSLSWIGSLSTFLQFAFGVVGGPAFDRFGTKVMAPAAILYAVSIMLLSLCTKYWHFMVVQGVLMGILMGLLQFPAFAAVSQYFEKKRAAALGIVVCGSSIGGVVLPIALSRMLNATNLGFDWSVRIIGFVMLPLIVFSCFAIRPRLPPRQSAFWITAAFRDRKFLILIGAFFFMFIGMFAPLFFIPTYAVMVGVRPTLAGYLLAIVNAASTFGRVIPGVLADKYGRVNMFSLGGVITGIVIFCLSSASSEAGLIVYSIIFGFCSGTIISGGSAAFSLCPKRPQEIGTYMGMGMGVASVAALVGPPVNGALLQHHNGALQVSVFSGSLCLCGGFLAFVAKHFSPEGIFGNV